VDFSPERGLLAAGSPNATVYVWLVSALSMAPVELHGHTAEITSLAFSPNTETLASASQDGTLVLWNAANITP
jgi:WD40 repeat protein